VERHQTLAAKTGYTDTAHYCFATVVRTEDGRRLAVVVLGAPTSDARFRDTEALLRWARDPAAPEAAAPAPAARKPAAKKAPARKPAARKPAKKTARRR
jgi:D-alanyl-D-alanine carboxypeptidase